MSRLFLLSACLLAVASVNAQLAVTVSSPKVIGQKAVVPLALKNNFTESITSARAAVFVSDERGKVVGQATRWVIGGQAGPAPDVGLEPKATNSFHFVVTSAKPFTTTNLTAKVIFNRVILEDGKSVDPRKSVLIQEP
jgi:hypothetical protein